MKMRYLVVFLAVMVCSLIGGTTYYKIKCDNCDRITVIETNLTTLASNSAEMVMLLLRKDDTTQIQAMIGINVLKENFKYLCRDPQLKKNGHTPFFDYVKLSRETQLKLLNETEYTLNDCKWDSLMHRM